MRGQTNLVKMPETLNEVIGGVGDLLGRDRLENWQELLERDPVVVLLALDQLSNLGLRRVGAQGPQNLSNLLRLKRKHRDAQLLSAVV